MEKGAGELVIHSLPGHLPCKPQVYHFENGHGIAQSTFT